MTDAPAEACAVAGPKSGAHPGAAIFAASPSNSPRLTSSRFRRAGEVAASSYRKTGTPNRAATAAPTSLARATQSAMVTSSNRNERHDIDGPEPGVSALVRPEVDCLERPVEQRLDGGGQAGTIARDVRTERL